MNDINEDLVILFEELSGKELKLDEISNTLQGIEHNIGSGPGFLSKPIIELKLIIVKLLGGSRKNLFAFGELGYRDPFYLLLEGNISRDEFLKQIKKGVELDLTSEAVLRGGLAYKDIL